MSVDPATTILTHLALLLLLGLIISLISKKFKVSNILLLLLAGLILGQSTIGENFQFDSTFLVALAVLTLVLVVFDGSSRFEMKSVNLFSFTALKVSVIFLFLNFLFITYFTAWLFFNDFSIEAVLVSMIMAFIMTGTDPGSVFILLKSKTNRVIEFLEVEAIVNTPIMVIFPFIILDILNNLHAEGVTSAIVSQFVPLLQQIVVGIGAGMVIGIVVFKSMKNMYSERYSPAGIITAALLAYILAENLGGNGVLAVATLGLVFANVYVKEKENLQVFSSMISNSLVILVFILAGLIIKVDFSFSFFARALVLFIILTITRLVSIEWGLKNTIFDKNKHFTSKEKLFMAISMPKGIAATVVAFSLSVFSLAENVVPMMDMILQLVIVMIVYSLIASSIVDRFSKKLIRIKIEDGG